MAKDLPNQTVYEDEKSRLMQDETYQGNLVDQSAWDLDRSTPVGTLKSLIRSINTHNVSTDLTIAKALVLRVEDQIKSLYESVNGGGDSNSQMARVMVLSDPRHYWIPEAKNSEDPAIGFYPLVQYIYGAGNPILKAGDLVEVQFNNPRAQFASHTETGKIINVTGHLNNKYAQKEIQQCLVSLPPIPVPNQSIEPNMSLPPISSPNQSIAPEPCAVVSNLASVSPSSTNSQVVLAGQVAVIPRNPVDNLYVTSPWNHRRTLNGVTRPHYGTDFRAPMGVPYYAALDGIITLRTNGGGPNKGYGYYAYIRHTEYSTLPTTPPRVFYTLYAHMKNHRTDPAVKSGQFVKRGTIIGYSGASGIGGGAAGAGQPHLHFEYVTYHGPPVGSKPLKKVNARDPVSEFIGKTFYKG